MSYIRAAYRPLTTESGIHLISTRWAGTWDANHAEHQIGIAVIEEAFEDEIKYGKFLERSCSSKSVNHPVPWPTSLGARIRSHSPYVFW